MTDAEAALEWQRFAEMDLNSAEFLLKMRPIPIEVICFHCQQSAEKSLKSILVFRSIFPPKTHDLQELMKLCAPYLTETESVAAQCRHLNQYSVRPRYPQEIDITEAKLRQAVTDAKTMFDYTKRFCPSR
ncbi:MAG: HEPN domain-containing protein [Planctomycetaceae bacterium]|nr:HEPN domain-containing protein [Planctomycetaceae bacterium]